MFNTKHIYTTLLLTCITASVGFGNSIWAKRSQASKDIYADDKANQIGDLLTIVISEDHKVDNKVKRDLSRNSSRSLKLGEKDISVEHVLPTVPEVNVNLQSGKSLAGKSDYKDERSIEDQITVVVVDIQPNGNLVVIGTRSREVNGDKQTIQVSGIVRPSDIMFGNSVRSQQVANFQLVTISDGVSESYTKQGWMGKFFDKIWPF